MVHHLQQDIFWVNGKNSIDTRDRPLGFTNEKNGVNAGGEKLVAKKKCSELVG